MPVPLEITFRGPFVFRFTKDTAWAYLAQCPNHYLNVVTDTDDVVPDKGTEHPLQGPTTKGNTKNKTTIQLVSLPWDKSWPTEAKKWEYCFKFPAPDSIYGLGAENIDIKNEAGKPLWSGKFARGLRFQYANSAAPQFVGLSDATHYDDGGLRYAIEIRYHDLSIATKPEDYYKDAKECFQNMRNQLPPCHTWVVHFDESAEATGPVPRDCGAPNLVLLDGITL